MSQTEAHVLEIKLDASDVDKGLARARTGVEDLQKSATKSAGGLTLIQGGLQGIDRAEREASKALRGFGSVVGAVNPQIMSTVGAIGDLAGILAGGGLAVGLAGAALLFSKLAESMKESREGAIPLKEALESVNKNINSAEQTRIAGYEERLRQLTDAVKNYGKTSHEVLMGELKDEKDRLLFRKQNLEIDIAEKKSKLESITIRNAAGRVVGSTDPNQSKSIEMMIAAEQDRYAAVWGFINDLNKKISSLSSQPDPDKKPPKVDRDKPYEYKLDAGQMLADAEANRKAIRDAPQIKARKELALELEKADQAKHERSLKRAFEQIDAQRKVRDEIDQTWANFGSQMTGTLVGGVAGGFATLFTEMAAGNKYAAEIALSSFLSSTGQQIIASGVQSVVQGTLYAVDPATAAAAPGMIIAGAAAIGIGTTMAAGGAGIKASIPRPGGAATGGRGSSSERGTGSGSSRGGGGGGDGGGATVININYAAGGPNPEDTARDISSVLDTARRRRFNRSNRRSL